MLAVQLPARIRVALVAMVAIASRDDCCGRSVKLAEIACIRQLSQTYLEQLFCRLRRAGLVTSARGPNGGYRLARPPGQIAIAEIVQAVEDPCDKPPFSEDQCISVDTFWRAMDLHLSQFLQRITLDDVVHRRVHLGDCKHGPLGMQPRAQP